MSALEDRPLRTQSAAVPPLPLAQGELDQEDARELQELKRQITRVSGFFCDGYKEKCLRRRIAVRMRARGVHRYADYAAILDTDANEYDQLLAAVTINVSKFFRNPETWAALRQRVVPALFARPDRVIRIWSAGSASGEEAYTVAILLLEHAAETGQEAALSRFRILGTDVDAASLQAARRAEYPALALAETPQAVRDRWFLPGGPPFLLREEVRRMVRFEQMDMLAAGTQKPQHLILCRNVVIYFERTVQESLFVRFADALVPGGFLLLGKVETMLGPAASRFQSLANAERLFQLR